MKSTWLWSVLVSLTSSAAAPVEYVREVRPILQQHCYECHGPENQKSGYRLDVREIAIRGGDSGQPAIVPHNASASPLIRYVSGLDEDMVMPPKRSGKPALTESDVATLRAWIEAGPAWPDELAGTAREMTPHWSLTPLPRQPVPANAANPVDAFVRAKLAARGLAPSPEADRRSLLRRLSYDVTGLPPTPEEVEAFMADPDPKAYERKVDQLLASPRHGEHWARHWLDVANYADTHGNDHDYARFNAWPYRDYVINAFNTDKPYARFVQEQVAGDALFPDDPQATVALGFLAAGPWDHTLMVTVREDTIDHRMAQNLDRDQMVSAAVGTFQSLTVHCARCHDHKFDPISQREYYSLQAVFAGVDRADRPFDSDAANFVQRTRLLEERRALNNPDAAWLAKLDTLEVMAKTAAWEEDWRQREKAWTQLDTVSVLSTGGASLTRQADGSWLVTGTRPDRDTYIVTARVRPARWTAVRLEVLPDDRLPQRGPGRWDNGNFHLTEFRLFAAPEGKEAKPVVLARAAADHDEGPTMTAAQAIDGKNETFWGVHPRYGERHEAIFEIKDPAGQATSTIFTILLENLAGAAGHGLGRFRISCTDEVPPAGGFNPLSAEVHAILQLPDDQRTAAQRRTLALAMLKEKNQRALAALPPPRYVYAVSDDFPPDGPNFTPAPEPRPIHLLARGDLNKPGELIGPGALACISGLPRELAIADGADESARRAALALWLTDERNVLTWRSIVNRVWAYHFGRGLCATPNDFGRMGGSPSHPELLDWLAVWFRDEAKGSIKALHRLILASETWRQSTRSDHGLATDSDNQLLWRQNRLRLTAEQVRDTLLALSGRLDLAMGGPSAVQFIDRGDATFNSGGNPAFLDYEHFDPDAPAACRRAVYRFLFRTVPDPFMDALDCPDGGAFTPVRSASSTALQAFALLNDPFLIRQSEHIAARVSGSGAPPEAQTEATFRLVLLRPPSERERLQFAAYIQCHGLANAAQLLLNSNEFLYLD